MMRSRAAWCEAGRHGAKPRGSRSGSLGSVSCPSARVCIAIGQRTNRAGDRVPLAERWNGRSWSILPRPAVGRLSAVSCTSATACTAVGQTFPEAALAERWNGTSWAVQPTPSLAHSGLAGVSCSSATACTAVGSYLTADDAHEPLAEAWNGTTWVFQATPTLNDLSSLGDVSCTSASACIAVGRAAVVPEGEETTPLAEEWNGTKWTVLTVPEPGSGGSLAGVSCASAMACAAVGGDTRGALAERWNGTAWAVQRTPRPAAAVLAAVSCSSAGACTAVGGFVHRARGTMVTLAERWNGTAWAIQRTPGNPVGTPDNGLAAISCTTARRCAAVGTVDRRVLAQRWNGRRWALQRIRNPATAFGAMLNAVSCTSARRCTAVGSYSDRAGSVTFDHSFTLAERWNGGRWRIQRTRDPPEPPSWRSPGCPARRPGGALPSDTAATGRWRSAGTAAGGPSSPSPARRPAS